MKHLTDQKFREVKYDTSIESRDAYPYPCTISYARWEGTVIITDYQVCFHYGFANEMIDYIQEVVEEIICGLEGTYSLEFQNKLVIE